MAKRGVPMVSGDVVLVQLATRVPKQLYRELKLYSVTANRTVADLVREAMTDALAKWGKGKKAA